MTGEFTRQKAKLDGYREVTLDGVNAASSRKTHRAGNQCRCENCVTARRGARTYPPVATKAEPTAAAAAAMPQPPTKDRGPLWITHLYGLKLPTPVTPGELAIAFGALATGAVTINILNATDGAALAILGFPALAGVCIAALIRRFRGYAYSPPPATAGKQVRAPMQPAAEPDATSKLAAATDAHQAVILAWAKYETDVALQIDFPSMVDVRVPETANLAKALRRAEFARANAEADKAAAAAYQEAVIDLESAFAAAETAAKMLTDGPLSQRQQSLAHTLLAMAEDADGNPQERLNAYRSLISLLEGRVALSRQGRERLEAGKARLEIGPA